MTSPQATATAPIEVPDYVTFVSTIRTNRAPHLPVRKVNVWTVEGEPFLTVGTSAQIFKPCTRCAGTGSYSFNRQEGTRCFLCHGACIGVALDADWSEALRLAKTRLAHRARAAKRQAAADEAYLNTWLAWLSAGETRPALVAWLSELAGNGGFLGDMANQVNSRKPLTERQEEAAQDILAKLNERAAAQKAAGHVGTVGKRMELEVTITKVIERESDYGWTYLVVMETPDGAVVKTWATGDFGRVAHAKVEPRDDTDPFGAHDYTRRNPTRAKIKGTVKSHGSYQDTPETLLSRVALVGWSWE